MGAIREEIVEILGKEKVASSSHQFGKRVGFHFLMKACPVKSHDLNDMFNPKSMVQ